MKFAAASGTGAPAGREILIRRRGALGDVVGVTPIVRRLKSVDPDAAIDIETEVPQIFSNNPYVRDVYRPAAIAKQYGEVIDLNLAYERVPHLHIVDAFAKTAFGHTAIDKTTELFFTDDDEATVTGALRDIGIPKYGFVAVHMARTVATRTLPENSWYETVRELADRGYALLQIGGANDLFFERLAGVYKLRRQLTVPQLACLLAKAACFLGSDSGLLHVAGTTETPIAAIFTSARAELRLPYRKGKLGYRCAAIRPKIECYGCLHRQPAPVEFSDCDREDYMCLSQILPHDMVTAVDKIARRG